MFSPGLLSIPTELRLEIYRHVCQADPSTTPTPNHWFPLLLTNKLVHGEVLTVLREAHLLVRIEHSSSVDGHNCNYYDFEKADWVYDQRMAKCEWAEDLDDEDEEAATEFRSYCRRFASVTLDIGIDGSGTAAPSRGLPASDLNAIFFGAVRKGFEEFLTWRSYDLNRDEDARMPTVYALYHPECNCCETQEMPWAWCWHRRDAGNLLIWTLPFERMRRKKTRIADRNRRSEGK